MINDYYQIRLKGHILRKLIIQVRTKHQLRDIYDEFRLARAKRIIRDKLLANWVKRKFRSRVTSYSEWELRLIRYAHMAIYAFKKRSFDRGAKNMVTRFLIKWVSENRLN